MRITFGGLKRLNIVEFWLSPIINDIEVKHNRGGMASHDAEPGFWEIINPINKYTNPKQRDAEIEQATELYKDNYFVRLFASYGASLALICETIDVEA